MPHLRLAPNMGSSGCGDDTAIALDNQEVTIRLHQGDRMNASGIHWQL